MNTSGLQRGRRGGPVHRPGRRDFYGVETRRRAVAELKEAIRLLGASDETEITRQQAVSIARKLGGVRSQELFNKSDDVLDEIFREALETASGS